jgi:hypothetical protein
MRIFSHAPLNHWNWIFLGARAAQSAKKPGRALADVGSNLRRLRRMDALLPQITGAQKKNFPAQKKNFPARAAGTSAVGASRAWHGLAAMKEAAVWPDETDLAHRLSKVSFIP